MEFTLIMLILLTIIIAILVLSKWKDDDHAEEERRAAEFEREQYLAGVYAKYNRKGLPMGFRRRIDFTGERPLAGAELEAVKKEVMR